MTDTASPTNRQRFLKRAGRFAAFAFLWFVGLGVWNYATEGLDGLAGLDPPDRPIGLWAPFAFFGCLIAGGLLANTNLLYRLPRQGVMPVPYDAGVAWTHSIAYRVVYLLFAIVMLAASAQISLMAFQAWQSAYWIGFAIVSLFAVLCGLFAVGCCFMLVARFAGLRIDPEDIEEGFVRVPWSEVEQIGLRRGVSDSEIRLYFAADHPLAPVHKLELRDYGLTAGDLLAKIAEMAPQVRIEWPEPGGPHRGKA